MTQSPVVEIRGYPLLIWEETVATTETQTMERLMGTGSIFTNVVTLDILIHNANR